MQKIHLLVLLFVWVTGASCSNNSDLEESDQDVADSKRVAAAHCSYYERCLPEMLRMFPGGDARGCSDFSSCSYDAMIDAQSEIINELPELDSARIDACVQLLEESGCDDDALLDARCNLLAVDLLAEGEMCHLFDSTQAVCEAGLFCAGSDSFCGVCTRYRALGTECGLGSFCVLGAYCSDDGVCETLKKAGDTCQEMVECENHYCINGQCAGQKDVGDSCEVYCGLGLSCIEGICTESYAEEGEACDFMELGCRMGLACVSGTCTAVQCAAVGLGEPCVWEFFQCGPDRYCDSASETCVPRKSAGAECESDIWCSDGLTCDASAMGVCAPPKELGASCYEGSECISGFCNLVCVEEYPCS
jgi:Dickkopf N-terminal cysteine-rich region